MAHYRILIDGKEFIDAVGNGRITVFEQTVADPRTRNPTGRTEYALFVYKPAYAGWMRERLVDVGASS